MKPKNNLKTFSFLMNNEADFCCYIQRKKDFHSLPQHIYFEPTNACNLRCLMCPRNEMKRKVTTMANKHFNRIIDDLVKMEAYPRITITGSGEPLMDKGLFDKVRYAKKNNFHVSIITNATILNEERSLAIIKCGLDRIQFSFDSIKKEIYDKIRIPASKNVESYFEATLKNIKIFLKLNKKNGNKVFTSVSSVQMDINRKDATEFTDFWTELGVDNVFLPEVNIRSGRGGEKKMKTSTIQATCILPFNELNIMSNGDIPPCGPTKELSSVGNAFENSIDDLWFGEKFNQIRNYILAKDQTCLTANNILCQKCNAWKGGLSFEEYFQYKKDRNSKILKYILV